MVSTDVNGQHCSSRPVVALVQVLLRVSTASSGTVLNQRLISVVDIATPPAEYYDPGFLEDSSDGILLKELKSIIQEHSTHRSFPPGYKMWWED